MALIDALQDATRGVVCGTLGTWDSGVAFAREAFRVPNAVPNPAKALNCLVCGGCDRPNPPNAPFTGGQCNGVRYRVALQVVLLQNTCNTQNQDRTSEGSLPIWGPIRAVRFDGSSDTICGGRTRRQRVVVDCSNSAGQPITSTIVSATVPAWESYSNVVFSRFDGQPDTCGNIPPPPPPPYPSNPPPVVVPVTYVNNEGDTVNIAPSIQVFAPIVGSFNNVFAPVRIQLPDIVFNGTVELFPDFKLNIKPEFNFGSPGKPDSPVPPSGNPGDDEPTDEDDDDIPLPIIGVHVRATVSSAFRATNLAQGNSPNLFVPRLGSVYFRVRIGNALSWTSDIPVKTVSQYVPCPELRGAIAVRSWADTGVTLNLTPVRGLPIATEQ